MALGAARPRRRSRGSSTTRRPRPSFSRSEPFRHGPGSSKRYRCSSSASVIWCWPLCPPRRRSWPDCASGASSPTHWAYRCTTSCCRGYSNGHSQYVTTPEEYVSQQYGAARRCSGRWTLCAYQQEFHGMARAMARGARLSTGPRPADNSGCSPICWAPSPPIPRSGKRFGDVVSRQGCARGGDTVRVVFAGLPDQPDPPRPQHQGLLFAVEKRTATGWTTASTTTTSRRNCTGHVRRATTPASLTTIVWRIPVVPPARTGSATTATRRHRRERCGIHRDNGTDHRRLIEHPLADLDCDVTSQRTMEA